MDEVGVYTLEVMKNARWYNKWTLSFFEKYLKGSILEVGPGIGNFTKLLSGYRNVTGIEINTQYLSRATNNKNNKCTVGHGDIEKGKYFFKNKKFDTVVCLNVLEHIKDDEKALCNIYRLLNKNGVLILLVPSHNFLYSKYDKLLGHYRRYNITDVRNKLSKCGFEKISARYFNWFGAFGWWFFLKTLKKETFPDKEVGIFDALGKIFLWPEKYIKFPFGLSVMAIVGKGTSNQVLADRDWEYKIL